jgi:branched-chain amino acid aminotransferase
MLNFNGNFVENGEDHILDNRAFLYGDGVFETVRILDGKVLFLEDHYFRLMSSMRVVRMQIPMTFTMEYIESLLVDTAARENCLNAARARITVFRNPGGYYKPLTNAISFVVSASALHEPMYVKGKELYEVELYKDFYITKQLLSSIKTTNKLVNITGSIFASENGFDNCLIMNDSKNVIEALNGNIFMLTGNRLVTPPVAEGCLNGVMRKQLLAIAGKDTDIEVAEEAISPFDLQKADELFITNVIVGIQSVTRYRKKEYVSQFAASLLVKLNAQVRLG